MQSTKQRVAITLMASAISVLAPATLLAQPAANAAKPASSATAQSRIEPAAVDLLKAATARLASARSLSFTATAGYEYPSNLGPAILYTVRYDVSMQRPDKLRVIVPGDGPASEFYYDGKTVMAYLPAEDLVAIADAPQSIEGALKQAYDRSGTYFPFADLIVADPYAAIANGMKTAYLIGESAQAAGVRTQMVAVANDAVFLQIWVGTEDKLPRRIRAVYRDDPLRLRHDMILTNWTVDGQLPAATFTSEKARQGKPMQFRNPALKAAQ